MPTRISIYVDGFNLYYWMKPLPYRWIDLKTLALNAIRRPGDELQVVAVKYFTANVSDTEEDPTKSTRQDVYFQALRASIPELHIYRGEFRRTQKWMPRANHDGSVGKTVCVWDTEEKGSDVNLAVELVNDAWLKTYDLAVVISNDSDLEHAVRTAKAKQRKIGILVRGDADVVSLKKVSNFYRKLAISDLKNALLPRQIPNTNIVIPSSWRALEDQANVRA